AANVLRTEKWSAVQEIEQRYSIRVDVTVEHAFLPGQDDFTFETDPNAVVIPIEEPNFGPAPRFEGEEPLPPDEAEEVSDRVATKDDDDDEEEEAPRGRRRRGRGRDRERGERRPAEASM